MKIPQLFMIFLKLSDKIKLFLITSFAGRMGSRKTAKSFLSRISIKSPKFDSEVVVSVIMDL